MRQKLFQAVGMESIRFQNGVFFNELTNLIEDFREDYHNEISNNDKSYLEADPIQPIIKCIKHHTGINTHFVLEGGPSVLVADIQHNSVLMNEFRKNYFSNKDSEKAMRDAETKSMLGTVSLENSKVTGLFALMENEMYYPLSMLNKRSGFTSEELAAIMLHEVGHIFTGFEFASRSVSTNQLIARIANEFSNLDSKEKRHTLLVSAKKKLDLEELDTEALSKVNTGEEVAIVLLKRCSVENFSLLGYNLYDQNSWEYLADEFATRHGAGKHIITGLDKLFRQYGHMSYRSNVKFIIVEIIKLIVFVASLVAFITPLIFLGIYAIMNVVLTDSRSVDYDDPKARFNRVKNQYVELIKNTKLPKEKIKSLIDDIEFIENKFLSVMKDRTSVFGMIYDFFSSKGAKERELQKDLENLIFNDLYVKAAQLKI